jgi:S-adenosylmethionine uptake transporter
MSSAPLPVTRAPLLPIAVCAFGIGLFTLMDAFMKGLSQELGAYTAMFWRSLIGIGLSGILFFAMRVKFPKVNTLKLHSIRAVNSAAMALLFFYGITSVPLAEGIALTFIAPLIALYLAALFLHEKIASTAIIASLIGFAGVLLIGFAHMQGEQTSASWLALAALLGSALLYALNIILLRKQAQAAGPFEIAFFQSLLVTLVLGMATPWFLKIPSSEQFIRISLSAVFAIASLLAISWAYARAQAQQLVPIEYSAFLWATLFGYLFFGEIVTPVVIAGTALIVAACWLATRTRG